MKNSVAFLLVLAMLCGCALAEPVLNVTGSGTVYVPADQVSVSLGVNMTGADLAVLQQQANETITAVCDALLDAGLAEEEISTSYFYISPRYDYSSEIEAITGYSINNTLNIKTENIDQIGAYIDAAFAAGANSFDSINFTVKDEAEARMRSLELAVEDARAKAEVLAAAAGMQLGDIITITHGSQQDYYTSTPDNGIQYKMESASVSAAGGTTVRAAQIQVTSTVQISYNII